MSVAEAVTLLAAVGAFIVSVTGAAISVHNAFQVRAVHTAVNSQSTKFEDMARRLGHAEGVVESAVGKLPTPDGGSA